MGIHLALGQLERDLTRIDASSTGRLITLVVSRGHVPAQVQYGRRPCVPE